MPQQNTVKCLIVVLLGCGAFACDSPPEVEYTLPDAQNQPPPECESGAQMECTTSCGTPGERRCERRRWGACVTEEICGGEDEDCDGIFDEGFGCSVGTQQACLTECESVGSQICTSECAWDTCIPPEESCNGGDDDCDGSTDEGTLCAENQACHEGACTTVQWIVEAEDPDCLHDVGRPAEGGVWAADVNRDTSGYLTYGPYLNGLEPGEYVAHFHVAGEVPLRFTTVASLYIDVTARLGSVSPEVIARAEVTGAYLRASFRPIPISLPFTVTSPEHEHEWRVFFLDRWNIQHDRTVIERILPP